MPLKIEQRSKYTGHEHWNWSVWLGGSPSELRRVQKVQYLLHPTFSPPTRLVENRRTKFRLNASGWGEFRIRADVHFTDGHTERLEHDLQLSYPAEPKKRSTRSAARAKASKKLEAAAPVPAESPAGGEPKWFSQLIAGTAEGYSESAQRTTAHVTFIHGMANKPSSEQLLRSWLDSLRDQEGIDLLREVGSVSMVYWADVLYADPLTELALESIDQLESLRGLPPAWEARLSPQEQFFVESLRSRLLTAAEESAPQLQALEGPATEERVPLPWFVKRPTMEWLLRDVHHYLFNVEFSPRPGLSYRVRDEIRRRFIEALKGVSKRPHLVVSHSMGTVIAYDCLMRVADCPAVDSLMTIGSPLGLDEIQDMLRPEWTRENGFPSRTVTRWVNVFDRLDPVAGFDPQLANDFQRAQQLAIEDIEEPNSGWWRHDIGKYLSGPQLRGALRQMLLAAPAPEQATTSLPPRSTKVDDRSPGAPAVHSAAVDGSMGFSDIDFLSKLRQGLDTFQHEYVKRLCSELVEQLSRQVITLPIDAAGEILHQLRRKRKFGEMRRVANAMLKSGHDAPKLRRLYVQALLDEGDVAAGLSFAEAALTLAASDDFELAELQGLIARAYKQWYVESGNPEWLQRAIAAYYPPFAAQPAQRVWHGINVVALLARASRDGIDVGQWPSYAELAEQILGIIAARSARGPIGYWDYATAMEACLALGRTHDALRWARNYAQSPDSDAFELASTLRQLNELWQLTPEREPGNLLLPLLEAALLAREGSELELDPGFTVAAHMAAAAQSDQLQKVLGFASYQPMKWLLTALERCRGVCRLETAMGQAVGTGFVVRGRELSKLLPDELLVLTNAHVLSKDSSGISALSEMEAYVKFELSAEAASRHRLGRIICSSPYSSLDFTLVPFEAAAPSDVLPFPMTFVEPKPDGKCRLNAIGHPRGGNLSLSIRDNLLIDFASPRLHYRTPTDPGSSGSPIFDDQWNLVALHHAGDKQMAKLHGPGFYEANEAIWIKAIKEEIDRQLSGQAAPRKYAMPLITPGLQSNQFRPSIRTMITERGSQMKPEIKQARLQRFLFEIAGEDRMEAIRAEAPRSSAEAMTERVAMLPRRQPTPEDAERAVEKTLSNAPLSPEEMFSLEAIVLPRERPVVFIENNGFATPESPWQHFATNPDIRARIETAIPSIGRVELPGNISIPFGGTAFVVGTDLLMTNRHVAELFASGLGVRNVAFRAGQAAGWDPRRERISEEDDDSTMLEVKQIVMIHPYWDMALLRVAGLTAAQQPLRLSVTGPDDLTNHEIAVIGYPAKDWRNDSDLQDFIFKRIFNVKRLQPGKIKARAEVDSFDNRVSAMTHDSSTLGGNSGSALVDVATGHVVGLHFAGRYLLANYAVPTFELARDQRVVDLGVNFVDSVAPNASLTDLWQRLEQERASQLAASPDQRRTTSMTTTATVRLDIGNVSCTIPLQVNVTPSVEGLLPPAIAAGVPLEGLKVPVIFPRLEGREGYDPGFLELSEGEIHLPSLTPAGEKIVARLDDDSAELKYHKFSIVMHKKRRMALYTAANVDWRDHVRKINGRKPTRKDLTGLPEGSAEKWVTDERIPENQQLPDEFYTKDGGLFDKGHLVRRDDVCWGASFKDIQKANGDTYHTTNCSPQVAAFNRSSRGEDNWGDLENLIQSETGAESAIVFSGPVLDEEDLRFEGVDKRGEVLIQIPSAFWKIVVVKGDEGPEAFGFVLEQDLADVPLEFAVPSRWRRYMRSISQIQKLLHGLASLEALVPHDQFESHHGRRVTGRLRR